ncbi:DgyrCDS10338 [Dimorphilus gyrociliatus]|uniref:DgyrCDS10338 n=1 Tax=Dimorphilus gyrociliatus TaxID=2664684 RepID=A0A7I8W1X2_9ANNE|nr:DgyrCDS10338 [Dimorphilus gyrociliatus]
MDFKWEEAEECLRRTVSSISDEKIIDLLHTYLRECYVLARPTLQQVSSLTVRLAQQPVKTVKELRDGGKIKVDMTTNTKKKENVLKLEQFIRDSLKQEIFRADVTPLAEEAERRVYKIFSNELPMNLIRKKKEIGNFILACAQLVWKMTIQQPMLTFDVSPPTFNPLLHEPLVPNYQVKKGKRIAAYAIPILRGAKDKKLYKHLGIFYHRGTIFGVIGSTTSLFIYGTYYYMNRRLYIGDKLKYGCLLNNENDIVLPYQRRPKLEQRLCDVLSSSPTNLFYIVNGQKGTGKTRTIVELIKSRMSSDGNETWMLYVPVRSAKVFPKDLYFAFNLKLEWYLKNLLNYTMNNILESILEDIEQATKEFNEQTGKLPVIVIDNFENLEEENEEFVRTLLLKANEWAIRNSIKVVFVSSSNYSSCLRLLENHQTLWKRSGSTLTIRDLTFEESFSYLNNPITIFDEDGNYKCKLKMDKSRICEIISLVGGRLEYLERFKKDWILGINFEETAQQLIEKENERLLIAYKTSEKWKIMIKIGKSKDGIFLEDIHKEFSEEEIHNLLILGVLKLKKSNGKLKLKFDSRLSKRVFEERMTK